MISRSQVRRASCPACGALPGQPCKGHNTKPRTSMHTERWMAYRELTEIQPKGKPQ